MNPVSVYFCIKFAKPLKRILPAFLAFTLLYNAVGYYIVYKTVQYQAKKEMKHRIFRLVPEKELLRFAADDPDFCYNAKFINPHEFIFGEKMYDIVKEISENGRIYYMCVNDEKEGTLLKNFNRLTSDDGPKKSQTQQTMQRLYKLLVNEFTDNSEKFTNYIHKNKLVFTEYNCFYSIPEVEMVPPPPKI